MANLILLFFVVIGIAGTSFTYYIFVYEITDEEFNQYLNHLFFPMTLLRRVMQIQYSHLDRSKLGNPKIARIIMTIILLFWIIPYLAITFVRTQNDEKVYQVIVWGIYIAAFIVSWRFGSGMKRFRKTTE